MTDEERTIITGFIQRVGGVVPPAAAGSVPATAAPLPPVDPDADRLIGDLFTQYPGARYRLTQTAFVQDHALAEAHNQIAQLQYALQQAQAAQTQQAPAQIAPPAPSPWGAAAQQPQPAPQPSRGLFGGLFGGGQPQAQQPQYQQPQYAPPPQPQYAPGYQPGMFQRQGSGFLGSALTTAAGVAGGMVAGNALMGMFSGNHGGGMFGGGGFQQPQGDYGQSSSQGGDPYGGAAGTNDQGTNGQGGDVSGSDSGSGSDTGSDSGWTDSGPDDLQNS